MSETEPNSIDIAPGYALPESAVSFTFARSGGPGGQHVNKTSSKAVLHVPLAALHEALPNGAYRRLLEHARLYVSGSEDELQIACDESRSQVANRRRCFEKLREVVVAALHRPKPRKKTRPSAGAVRRRIEAKKQRGERKRARQVDRNPRKD